MSVSIEDYFHQKGDTRPEIDKWHEFLRDHIGAGFVQQKTTMHQVDAGQAVRYEGDLFGYLRSIGCSQLSDWVHLLLNQMKHPTEFGPHLTTLRIITDGEMDMLWTRFHGVYSDIEYI